MLYRRGRHARMRGILSLYPSRSETPRPICVKLTADLRLFMKSLLPAIFRSLGLRVRNDMLPTNFGRKIKKKVRKNSENIMVATRYSRMTIKISYDEVRLLRQMHNYYKVK